MLDSTPHCRSFTPIPVLRATDTAPLRVRNSQFSENIDFTPSGKPPRCWRSPGFRQQACATHAIDGEVDYLEPPMVNPEAGMALICSRHPRINSANGNQSLNGLGDNCTFGDICVRLAQQGPADEVPAVAAQLLMEFFANGWITAIKGTLASRGNVNLTPWPEIPVTHRSTD